MSTFIGNAVIFLFKLTVFVGLPVFGIAKCQQSEWYQASEREKRAQEKADATPHVIREADGCKVYAFKSGGTYHYFTRCGATVTTERIYAENCGKNCTKQKSEVIVTENNK
jgi:hypothetical protein